jgi:hypothetical protein
MTDPEETKIAMTQDFDGGMLQQVAKRYLAAARLGSGAISSALNVFSVDRIWAQNLLQRCQENHAVNTIAAARLAQ